MTKSLPVYKTLEYTETLPISKTVVAFRPYNVGDERKLLAAQAAKESDPKFYATNTVSVIQNAIINGVSINKLPATDVRMLLLKQRSKSVGEKIDVTYEKETVQIDIDKIRVDGIRNKEDYKIDIGGGYFVKMKDLSFEDEIMATADIKKNEEYKALYSIMVSSIEAIYTNDDIWNVGDDITKEEAEEFLYGIPKTQAEPLYAFIQNSPKLATEIFIGGKEITVTDRDVDFLA